MSRRYTEWSQDGTVEVVTYGPSHQYEVFAIDHAPGLLLGPHVGTVTKDVYNPRTHEWVALDSQGQRFYHPTLASALTRLANREAQRREAAARRALDAEAAEFSSNS